MSGLLDGIELHRITKVTVSRVREFPKFATPTNPNGFDSAHITIDGESLGKEESFTVNLYSKYGAMETLLRKAFTDWLAENASRKDT